MANIIDAILNLVENPVIEIQQVYKNKNRANSAGDALEAYIIDLFAGTFHFDTEQERIEQIAETFSYLGNNSNPPDAMLKNGDAIEVKKIETQGNVLVLNSSYPKQKLCVDSAMISSNCKSAEKWTHKDLIYTTGLVEKEKLKHLSMIYGLDYCASSETYEKIKNAIKNGITAIPNIELTKTKELGKLNKVDPLGITYLRVRGMWGIENPCKVFNYVYTEDTTKQFNFMCIINQEKWNTFSNTNLLLAKSKENKNLSIQDIKIKNPDNPAQLRNAKLITFTV